MKRPICDCHTDYQKNICHCHLHAAAPELLSALKEITRTFGSKLSASKLAAYREVIAKASNPRNKLKTPRV